MLCDGWDENASMKKISGRGKPSCVYKTKRPLHIEKAFAKQQDNLLHFHDFLFLDNKQLVD